MTIPYKLLIQWAQCKCRFSERYEPLGKDELPPLDEGAFGFRCYVLRDDAKDMHRTLTQAGATWEEAMDIVTTSAVGIVTTTERMAGDLPRGWTWTWEDTAKKRALTNALSLAYGAPNPQEIAEESRRVEEAEEHNPDHLMPPSGRKAPEVENFLAELDVTVKRIRARIPDVQGTEPSGETMQRVIDGLDPPARRRQPGKEHYW